MGALVTLELPADSPLFALPWIITFGPLSDDEDWEPAVCGPYERAHALGLAEAVVGDNELMAVVEPLLPRVTVDEIRRDIAEAKQRADEPLPDSDGEPERGDEGSGASAAPPTPDQVRSGFARIAALLTGA